MSAATSALEQHCLRAVQGIEFECRLVFSCGQNGLAPKLANCGEPLVELLKREASKILRLYHDGVPQAAVSELTSKRLEDLLSISYAKFYAYVYSELPIWWRQMYTDASILKFCLLFLSLKSSSSVASNAQSLLDKELDEMVKTLDLALILAGAAGEARGRRWIDEALALLEEAATPVTDRAASASAAISTDYHFQRRAKLDASVWASSPAFSTAEHLTPSVTHPIRRTKGPISLEAFQTHLDRPASPQPLIIPGLIDDWPARTTHPWDRPAYLLSRTFGGRRLVPVELGRSYVDDGWGQKLVAFGELVDEHLVAPAGAAAAQTAYLAQHALLTQLPALRADVRIPDLCYASPPRRPGEDVDAEDDGLEDGPRLNAWLGPAGTITPLHTDPSHNLLAQVVGRKYVRLYAPWEGARMRPRGREEGSGVEMGNTSLWDVGREEGWDSAGDRESEGEGAGEPGQEGQAPGEEFADIPFVDCILGPGDTLYIPMGWWHYVRGLSVSFSVSFWWN